MSGLLEGLEVGQVVATSEVTLTRESLVRYAGASLDFNPIHYRDDVAQSVGLEGVLAHGMLTMGLAISPVQQWLGDAGVITSYSVRFTKPVYVPKDGGVEVEVSASVVKIDDPAPGAVTLQLAVTTGGASVLGKAQVVVSAS